MSCIAPVDFCGHESVRSLFVKLLSVVIVWVCLCRQTLHLSRQLADRVLEAQACYSLGNAYTLLGDYVHAIEYHALHLKFARDLNDGIGESRACWSLTNAHRAVGNCEQAASYMLQYHDICHQVTSFGLLNCLSPFCLLLIFYGLIF